MRQQINIEKSVGRRGVNRSKDVTVIQTRLNQWIAVKSVGWLPLTLYAASDTPSRSASSRSQPIPT